MLNEEPSPAIENTDDPAVAKKDDPAFLYFPTNYRWSMGLLICLSGAPWTGVEIDEVNRVGRALADKVGDDDASIENYVRNSIKTAFHPAGTCKMGADPLAVVDPSLRVYGVSGLRVADASIMPTVVRGNTTSSTVMIGEKAADLIKQASN